MNTKLARAIYLAGARLRGTPFARHLAELEESQWWTEEEIREMQLRKLRGLLRHAREHSPFYRDYFRRHGFDCDIGSLGDLKALPSLGKKDMVAHRDEIQNRGLGGRLVFSKTSGTTSVLLSFYRTSDWDAAHRAAIARGYHWYGVDLWMRAGILWSIPPGRGQRLKARAADVLLNRFRQSSFEMGEGTLEPFYRKLTKATYLDGYTGMLYEFARFVNERHPGERRLSLKLVKGTSEKIYPHYQVEARKAFGRTITSEYGAAEAGIIAFECPQGSLHVNMDHAVVELEQDEIVLTNLVSHSFPFIRYRLGDYIRLKPGFVCPCGRKGLVIDEIVGRVGLRIRGKGGAVFPSVVIDLVIKPLVFLDGLVARCQAVQRVEGAIEFNVVPAKPLDDAVRRRIEQYFVEAVPRFFGDKLDYRVVFVDAIPRPRGKFLEFVSEIERPA
jgi:phenylacetate-CoA ligase